MKTRGLTWGGIIRFSEKCQRNPAAKEPIRLTARVPQGNMLAVRLCTAPETPYRSSAPMAPPTAIYNSLTKADPLLMNQLKLIN